MIGSCPSWLMRYMAVPSSRDVAAAGSCLCRDTSAGSVVSPRSLDKHAEIRNQARDFTIYLCIPNMTNKVHLRSQTKR